MHDSLRQFSGFVGELNARARECTAHDVARWAVSDLADRVGFDAAWYGWAKLEQDSVSVHASAALNLPKDYYDTWCHMADQDLLAAGVRENPAQTSAYDRQGNQQTDGMVSLADHYGISKMATAMHERPNRTTSFFLSSYRGGQHAKGWSQDELDYIKCAVDQLSDAMSQSSDTGVDSARKTESTLLTNSDGLVILGLQNFKREHGDKWADWHNDQLPPCMQDLVNCAGEHILVDRQLVLRCEPAGAAHHMDLRKLTVRPLTKFDLLTAREQQVATLLASGHSHKETARTLGIAPATVRNQTQSIYLKLNISSRAELAGAVKQS